MPLVAIAAEAIPLHPKPTISESEIDECRLRQPLLDLSSFSYPVALHAFCLRWPTLGARPPTPEEVLAEAARYTVKVNVQTKIGLNADNRGDYSGTGFLIDKQRGWFLTNAHVASRSPGKITLTFKDGKPIPAKRVQTDASINQGNSGGPLIRASDRDDPRVQEFKAGIAHAHNGEGLSAHAHQHGFHIKSGKRAACFSNGSVEIGLTIAEGHRRKRHIPTCEEKAQLRAWERRGRNSTISYPRIPDWDYFADERLHLTLEKPRIDYGANIRCSFNDTRLKRLETMPEQVGMELAVIAAARNEFLARKAEKQRRADEKQKRREEGYRREYILNRRREGVAEILKEAGDLELMATRLAALKQFLKGSPRGPRVKQLVEWAGQDLARRRKSISAEKLESRLAERQLFGLDDGRGFKPHPYRKDTFDFEWDDDW